MPIFAHPFRTPKTLRAFTRSLSQVGGFLYFAPTIFKFWAEILI